MDALKGLQPVSYRLNVQADEPTLGFVAGDLPELVASADRDTVNPMKIVAVLTRALQAQQQLIENQRQEAIPPGRAHFLNSSRHCWVKRGRRNER